VIAGDDGRYEIRLPYATRGGPPGVRADAAYGIVSEGRRESVIVDERDVRGGARVDGPDFSAP
jgi:hypothetical protein